MILRKTILVLFTNQIGVNMKDYLLFQMHIMWYEYRMVREALDSLQKAISNSNIDVKINLCLNYKTYLEEPVEGTAKEMFDEFMDHSIIKKSNITYKGPDDDFYNIGDWRREQYDVNAKYTIWGETDTIYPQDLFYILENINLVEPHILTLASRKMWDSSWDIVEHPEIRKYPRTGPPERPETAPEPLNSHNFIHQNQLDDFNEKSGDIEIIKLPLLKIDGSTLMLSKGLPHPFIAPEQHFVREDTCASHFFKINNIPQYLIENRIKGHNYWHPEKRMNTKCGTDGHATRKGDLFQSYAKESEKAMIEFLNEAQRKTNPFQMAIKGVEK